MKARDKQLIRDEFIDKILTPYGYIQSTRSGKIWTKDTYNDSGEPCRKRYILNPNVIRYEIAVKHSDSAFNKSSWVLIRSLSYADIIFEKNVRSNFDLCGVSL